MVFSQIFQWLVTKLVVANYAYYNFFIALRSTVLRVKSLVTRVFFEFTPVFPENSLANGLQQQSGFLGTERVKLNQNVTQVLMF